ncbi:RHS repeat domain-containing protein [Desulforegula conservatrix]|uniref:RHS repeat domain-containing protein n=1 Tax=Desulforegula conservatrix TaxID=153026 RepID=UPI0004801381|nr:RHS repeat-associated core domain-containing protein [Desulforegula conservatrix]
MTVAQGMIYSYDAENRLVEASPQNPQQGSVKSTYIYDYMGRRAQKTLFTYFSGSWQKQKDISFVYDGWNMVKESEKSSDSSPEVPVYYVWGLDLSQSMQGAGGVGGLIASVKSGNEYLYSFDANGNVGQMVKSTDGTIAARYEYDPFGKTIFSEGPMASENPYRFSTKYLDAETGFYYYGFRYYDVDLGRWINRDPMGEIGGINLYSLVDNNSVSDFDYLGLWKRADELSHIWIAEEKDNLPSLAGKAEYGGVMENWKCLWPEDGTKNNNYPNIKACDRYDASNLAVPAFNTTKLEVIADDVLAGNGGSYKLIYPNAIILQGDKVGMKIKSISREGSTPIESFVLAGHGGVSGHIGGIKSRFEISALLALDEKPTFDRARQRKGPVRCWFTRDATARFSGCSSRGVASDFASKILRTGAKAIGTKEEISTTFSQDNGPKIYWGRLVGPNRKVYWMDKSDYYFASVWTTFEGEL